MGPVSVRSVMCRCKPRKAPRPDGISAKVLKNCARELLAIVYSLFSEAYFTATIPYIWKKATTILSPRSQGPLTSTITDLLPSHRLEKLLLKIINRPNTSRPLQFAYKAKRASSFSMWTLQGTLPRYFSWTDHGSGSI